MSFFTKEEKMNMKTGKFENKKGGKTFISNIPKIKRKQPSDMDIKIKEYEIKQREKKKAEREKRRSARKKKIEKYSKKINSSRKSLGKHINPDLLGHSDIGLDFDLGFGSGSGTEKKHKKNSKPSYIIRNGVAYKVAGTGKKIKRKSSKKKKSSSGFDIDPFDFRGF